MTEMIHFVFFDISNTRIRNKVNEKCKDYGLSRLQMSGFKGSLNRTMRARLIEDIKSIVGKQEVNIYIQPVCSACENMAFSMNTLKKESMEEEKLYFGMPLNQTYLHYED